MESNSMSLKKLKKEAAQKRKAQARSLKLHAEEEERLQRLEIDALVEQQRLQRLERQLCKENAAQEAVFSSGSSKSGVNEDSKPAGKVKQAGTKQERGFDDRKKSTASRDSSLAWGDNKDRKNSKPQESGNNQQQQQEQQEQKNQQKQHHQPQEQQQQKKHLQERQQQLQQMRALAETRRKLSRAPRIGNLVGLPESATTTSMNAVSSQNPSAALPLEDHRVVSTEYQAAGTQALMRVTLLAAGFVIGARGISARLIGQITGAIIQSWTESSSCRSTSGVPVRLFRIQGKKAVVHAAVSLVEQAVAKYKELCECKRRGEFVQREHVINGVEFYYQPPPRKAFASVAPDQLPGISVPPPAASPPSTTSTAAMITGATATSPIAADVALATTLAFPTHHVWLHHLQQSQKQKQAQMQKQALEQEMSSGLQQEKPGTAGDREKCEQAETAATGPSKQVPPSSAWRKSDDGSSLFSIFGNGGLPLPIAQDFQQHPSAAPASVSSTPFDFPKYDFFREILPTFPAPQQRDDNKHKNKIIPQQQTFQMHLQQSLPQQATQAEAFCVVCVERRSTARLMTCGHASFCLSCVQELGNCPVCREKIVGWQPLRNGVYDLWNFGTSSSHETCLLLA